MVPVLLITGTVGVGKTTIGYEVSDILAEHEVPHAFVDLDALRSQWPPSSKWNADLMFENLASLWPNFQGHGATHLVLAEVIEDRAAELPRYVAAVPGAEITVVRLQAQHETRTARLTGRMPPGPSRDWHLHRTGELEMLLSQRAPEDFVADNGDRAPREVAVEILDRLGWLAG